MRLKILVNLVICCFTVFACKQKAMVAETEPTMVQAETTKPSKSASQDMFDQLEMTNEQRAGYIGLMEQYKQTKRAAIRSAQANPEGMEKMMKSIQARHETELQALFSAEQYVQYLEYMSNR